MWDFIAKSLLSVSLPLNQLSLEDPEESIENTVYSVMSFTKQEEVKFTYF